MMQKSTRLVVGGLAAAALVAFTGVQLPMATSNAATQSLPAPVVDESVSPGAPTETAMLAGGCFWGVQGLFQHVDGVTAAESGYAGGAQQTANYAAVSRGDTGHAESVRITYDPTRVTFGQLLRVFFSVVEDPAQLAHQPSDSQYRSTIFAQDDNQRRIAQSYIAQLNQAAAFPSPIVTTVSAATPFFPAERYHQDFMNSNPTQPYIATSEMPKLAALKQVFAAQYRDQPVLVLSDGR